MALSSYPRVTVQGTSNANNVQNGFGLMVFNSTTGKYEAATAATFGGGGGGGGDATAANQTTQIGIENTIAARLYEASSGYTAAELIGFVANLLTVTNATLNTISSTLSDIKNNQTNATQKTQIVDSMGTSVDVDGTTKSLNTNVQTP